MKLECADMERLLAEEDPGVQEALRVHGRGCPSCRERILMRDELSAAARQLQKEWDTPFLWPRIRRSLENEAAAISRQTSLRLPRPRARLRWAAASAALLLLAVAAVVLLRSPEWRPVPEREAGERLLTEQALREVEITEAAYVESIDRLGRLAGARVASAATPLMANYREKLALIDDAIAECRAAVDRNPLNTHARGELLAMYQEKQRTLQQVMEEKPNGLQ